MSAGGLNWTGVNTNVLQGEFRVSDAPDTILTTVLGSCIAACLCDPVRGVGGMNHFLLAGDERSDPASVRYGINLMELLINELLKNGARRDRLEAKVFGGGRMLQAGQNIGESNARFALWFLNNEGIRCVSQSVGGTKARKLRFRPSNGQVQQQLVEAAAAPPVRVAPKPVAQPDAGGMTLF